LAAGVDGRDQKLFETAASHERRSLHVCDGYGVDAELGAQAGLGRGEIEVIDRRVLEDGEVARRVDPGRVRPDQPCQLRASSIWGGARA
jgi:hypothetical protein